MMVSSMKCMSNSPRAQPVQRLAAAPQRVIERRGRDALGPDAFRARRLDRLNEGHPILDEDQPPSFEVTPSGRPTTVTSMPPPSRRLATRLASAKVTASIRAERRSI
jgi:hypothetical protein